MATYLQRPDSLSLLGNLKSFLIGSSSEVLFELRKDGTSILAETYCPNSSGNVEIQLKEVIGNYLATRLPSSDTNYQNSFAADFVAYLDGANSYSFRVVNAGKRTLATSASQFLTANWLTWQPQVKRTVWGAPEYLTYYFSSPGQVKAQFYLKSGSNKTVTVGAGSAPNTAVTFNVSASRLFGLSGEDTDDLYGIVDVWVENGSGNRLSYIQRYILDETQGDEHFYMCVNSLGGLDTYVFHGACALAPDISHENAELGDRKVVITDDAECRWEQTTGYASMKETSWIFELISAKNAWAVMDGTAEPIAIDASSLHVSDRNNLHSCSFSFTLTEGGRYLNISRTDGTLPAIEVPSPSGEIFFLDLRLSDYPDSDLAPTSLLLLQSPFSDTWFKASLGAITDSITQDILAAIPPAQSNQPLILQYGPVESEAQLSYDGGSRITARIPSRISHLADRTSIPYLGQVGEDGLVQLRDSAGNSIYPALRQVSFWGNTWNGGNVSGPLTFTAGQAPSQTADLEVISIGGQRCLHTRLPFFSDVDLAVGGPGSAGGSAGGATYLYQLDDVQVSSPEAGQILKYNGTRWMNAADEGGSQVSWTQRQDSGTRIATISIDGVTTDVYSPSVTYSAGTGLELSGTTFLLKRATSSTIGGVQLAERGNSGVPVFFDSTGNSRVINYLNVATEAGSIILPFLSNDLAFLMKRGGSATISGDYTGTPELDKLFNGQPDYMFCPLSSQDGEIVLTINLPTDKTYNYGQILYVDFGTNSWRANSIRVQCYHRDYSETEPEAVYKTIDGTCDSPFWVAGRIGTSEGYKITKIVFTFFGFQTTGALRITQIGLQHFNSMGAAAAYMSRGNDDRVWRSISPASSSYTLGAAGSPWGSLFLSSTGTIYAGNTARLVFNASGSIGLLGATYTAGNLTPNANTYSLGTAGNPWSKLQLLTGGSINVSAWGSGSSTARITFNAASPYISLTGDTSVNGTLKLAGQKKIWFGDTYYIELDSSNQLHTNAAFVSEVDLAVGGPGSGSGGSGGSTVAWGASADGYQYLNVSGYAENSHRVALYGHSHDMYSLTLQAGSFTGVTYTPSAAAKTVSIPTTLDHLADGNTRKLSDFVTIATVQNNISGRKTFTGGIGATVIYQGTSNTERITLSDSSSYNSANVTLNGSARVYGDLWISDGRNYGNKLIFGDRNSSNDYCFIQETPDDSLTVKAANILPPSGTSQNLGSSSAPWGYLYAKRWYPDPTNAPGFYVEYSNANQALTINGNLIVTGDVAVGAYASGTASFPVSVAGTLTPVSNNTFDLGTTGMKFNYVYARYIGDSSNYLTALYSTTVTASTLNAATVNITGILSEPTLTISENIESYLNGNSGSTSSALEIASLYGNIANIVNGRYRKLAIGAYTLQVTGYRNYSGQYSVYAGRYWFEQQSAASNYWYIHRL